MEAYLALRGLRTLPLRLARAQASAQILAERLATHPSVLRVRFPGLPDDHCHEVARRTMSGFGSLISIDLADARTADAFVDACALWAFATSLGGVESTLERRRRWRLVLGEGPVVDPLDDMRVTNPPSTDTRNVRILNNASSSTGAAARRSCQP